MASKGSLRPRGKAKGKGKADSEDSDAPHYIEADKTSTQDEEQLHFGEAWRLLKRNYSAQTPKKIMILDAFLVFLLYIAATQTVYMLLAGTFPFNSYLSAVAASIGTFTMGLALRLQVTKPEEFDGVTPERALADFLLCNVLLHVAVVTFLG
eukprot:Selendium_serpulae@DN4466_c0_g1_i1.p2